MDLLWFVISEGFGCYLMIIFSQEVAAAWFSLLLLEEKVHGFGYQRCFLSDLNII